MKNCRDVEPLKTPYVDGEATAGDRAEVERHIGACGRCRDEVVVERAARDVLGARRDELRGTCPDRLRASIASAIRPQPRPAPAPLYRRWVPMSLAATLLLVVGGIFALGLTDKGQALAFQTTVDHVKCVRSMDRLAAADAAVESARFASRYGWPVQVAASSIDSDLELREVRRCGVTDGQMAHIIYKWRGQPLSVYVLPSAVLPTAEEVHRFGHDAVMWSQKGRTYIVLTRAPRRAELDSVVGYMKANVY